MIYFYNGALCTPSERVEGATLLIRDRRIAEIGTDSTRTPPEGAQAIDLQGKVLAPGFIDLQLNGALGDDFTSHPETIWRVAARLPRFGITSFLPTLITAPSSQVRAAQQVLAARPQEFHGAEPLGLHLEGPFLNPLKKGAHNPDYIQSPNPLLVRDWAPASMVRMVTLAPELPGALDLVRELVARGVIVSVGHTMASSDEANAGYLCGARYATHLFNAMRPLNHQEPGVVGAVLANPDWIAGIIPDGVHVHPSVVKTAWLAKRGNLNLVSDAMGALGMPPGTYALNDFEVEVSERDARLTDGTLAGSILPLDRAVRNLIEYTGCTLSQALETVTTTPARLLGIAGERGSLRPGLVADLVVLDVDLHIHLTVAAGNIVYSRK